MAENYNFQTITDDYCHCWLSCNMIHFTMLRRVFCKHISLIYLVRYGKCFLDKQERFFSFERWQSNWNRKGLLFVNLVWMVKKQAGENRNRSRSARHNWMNRKLKFSTQLQQYLIWFLLCLLSGCQHIKEKENDCAPICMSSRNEIERAGLTKGALRDGEEGKERNSIRNYYSN